MLWQRGSVFGVRGMPAVLILIDHLCLQNYSIKAKPRAYRGLQKRFRVAKHIFIQ